MVRCKDELKKEIALFLLLTFIMATAVYLAMPEMARGLLVLFPWLTKHLSIANTALNDSYTWTPEVGLVLAGLAIALIFYGKRAELVTASKESGLFVEAVLVISN